MNLQQLTAEFKRNKTKSMVLGGLLVMLAAFGVKAALDMRPRAAAASAASTEDTPAVLSMKSGEMEQKVQQAAALWQVMRTKRGIAAAEAFRFKPERHSYVMIMKPRPQQTETKPSATVVVAAAIPTPEELEAQHKETIEAESKALVLHAVLMGDNPTVLMSARKLDSKPNRYGFNDEIEGFQITKIKERSVLVMKEGIAVEISLPDAPGKNAARGW